MKEAYLPREETLLTEIRNWKNTENLCKGVYDDGTLKSRNFLRLKMQTYRRLYRKYRGTGLSLDEEALHRMLRYHYKKIEKELYPSLPLRLGRRAWAALVVKLEGLVKGGPVPEMFIAEKPLSVTPSDNVMDKNVTTSGKEKEQAAEQGRRPEGWWVNDLGKKKRQPDREQNIELH